MHKILFVFLPYYLVFAQPFQISVVPTEEYSVDRFENTVYYLDRYTWEVYQTDLDNGITQKSELPFIPSFANKSHKAVYSFVGGSDRNIYLHDFDLDTTYVLISRSSTVINKQSTFYSSFYIFSPDDSKLLLKDSPSSAYFSFKDSTVYDLGVDLYNVYNVEWSSDVSLVYQKYGDDNVIMQFNTNENKADTLLLVSQQYAIITSFSFNISSQELAHSIRGYPPNFIPQIFLFNIYTKENKIIFDPPVDDPDSYAVCWSSAVALTSLKWSLNGKQLAFFSTMGTYSGSGIYTYNKDSLKTYRHTLCDDYGLKYDIDWLNEDTLIYFNSTEKQIFGFKISKKTVGIEESEVPMPDEEVNLDFFPNPFNSSVLINIKGKIQSSELLIYNINGELVKSFRDLNDNGDGVSVVWDGKNDYGQNVSSGIYLLSLINNNAQSSHLIVQKIINLK